jgi:NAD(P)-dependent dehydrogenase (short-subunit alcohol dehydrogenase family)
MTRCELFSYELVLPIDEPFAIFMNTITKDPRKLYPQPPYSAKDQTPPGTEGEMSPKADHGESSYKGTGRLQGRHALITGADSGIGRAVALAFAREGADVAISYLSEEKDARETERLVTEAGRKALLLPGDIGKPSESKAVAQKAIEAFGRIDILVNNAAFQRTYEHFEDISEEEFEETYRVNVFAMFRLCKALLPQMKEGGSIINTGSIQSFDPSSNLIAYASTKAAIVSFTRSLASLAIKKGVRVNAVAPGPVWTPLIPSTMPKEKVKKFGSQTVFGRAAQPAELAPVYVFLASDEASYVTGEVYGATGGQMPI